MKKQNYRNIAVGVVIVCCGAIVLGVQAAGKEQRAEDIIVEEVVNTEMLARSIENIEEIITVQKNEQPIVASVFTDSSETELNVTEEEENTETVEEPAEEIMSEEPEEKEPNLVIADVTNYVNVRDSASEEGEIVGKLYDNSVGTLLGTEGDWYYIESGCVTGYVKGEFVLTGNEAKVRADEVGVRMARVTTTTLKVRMEPSLEAKVLGLVPEGDLLTVSEEVDGFVKVSVEEGDGYVSTDYVEVYTENVVAESIKDEQERLAREAEERRKAEEAARKAIEQQKAESSAATVSNNNEQTASSVSSNSDLGQQIVDFAVQFVGNPYVYGGTSLTNGADCSGFVMSVYANFGISLPRTSGAQGKSGSSVASLSEAMPGDLIWYSGHIGIYMGNNQLVHASNKKDGIKISDADYKPILGIRRIV